MGDLIGSAVAGNLIFVPESELVRVRELEVDRYERAALFADACRLNALYMIARAGSGHIGSSFSSLDIVSYLELEVLRHGEDGGPEDLYFSSKGHDAPGLYAALLALGKLPFDLIHRLRRLGGLPGHPDVETAGIVANTGSLGMGISKAKGIALAKRHAGRAGRIYVLSGDGELQEGQLWESLGSATTWRLAELTLIVDHNKLQSDTFVEKTSPLGDLEAKFRSFGWHVERADGHDLPAFAAALERAAAVQERPQVVIADTVKGRGVSFMEHTSLDSDTALYRFHSGAPDTETYGRAASELCERVNARARALGAGEVRFATVARQAIPADHRPVTRLIPAYEKALASELERTPELCVLDADLAVDTGQGLARSRFPERFYECGIAEMDMVSMAGQMARFGLLPVCHSFACFLSARPNEQIYNNATERSKVVYVASLAGLLPAGPGHSHQGVRDVNALSAVPNLVMFAPSTETAVADGLAWAIHETRSSVWLRLESVPWPLPFSAPPEQRLREGVGSVLREGRDAVFISYGPVMLSQAFLAAESLQRLAGLSVGVIDLPWLNRVDRAWLVKALAGVRHVFAVENHYSVGGQADFVARALLGAGIERPPRFHVFGVEGIPACGQSNEVLKHHGLDVESLFERAQLAIEG
jgi:transketolase